MNYKTLFLDLDNKLCLIDDKEVRLTKNEFILLALLLGKPNFVHSREDIINNWDRKVSNRAVDTNIMRLRKKLGKYGKNIYTRLGFGYGFSTTI